MAISTNFNLSIQWEKFSDNEVFLHHGELHLWLVSLKQTQKKLALLRKLLSTQECQRADRFIFPKHQRRYTTSQAYLRIILSKYIAVSPDNITFSYGEYGKPFIKAHALQFNMSRSDEFALYGIVMNADLGVDIETWRDQIHYEGITHHNFSISEVNQFQHLPEDLKKAGFYKGWTCKEAFIKAIGKGLYFPLDRFSICMDPKFPAKLLAVEDKEITAEAWVLSMIPIADNVSAAFAVNKEVENIKAFIL